MSQSARFEMRMSEELREMLDELRRAEQPVPTHAEMVRRLVMRAYMRLQAGQRREVAQRGEELAS